MTEAAHEAPQGALLEVDLAAFAANLAAVRSRVAPAELMLVVKDDAYAQGLTGIVTAAREQGVDAFGAFDIATGVAVRRIAGNGPRIFTWVSAGRAEIDAARAHDSDLGAGDLAFLTAIAEVAGEHGVTARVHLKIDTGLHRNGIRPEDWADVLERARAWQDEGVLRIVGVWSHIAEASDADDDAARALFDDAVAAAERAGFEIEVRHLAASAAAFARPEFRYDAVRIGAFCYGVRSAGGPGEGVLGIRPIARVTAPVVRVDTDAVTVAFGFLDGLPSTLAEAMAVATPGGERAVRAIDAATLRVDPWEGAAVGQRVTVFGGDAASATDLAERIDTVGEEILTRVSPLIPRVYH